MKFFCFIFAMTFSGLSCKQISLISEGVRKPKIENKQSIEAFLTKVNCHTEKSAVLNFSSLMDVIIANVTPTSVYVFNKKGEFIQLPGATNKCAPEPSFFLRDLGTAGKEYKPVNNGIDLEKFKRWIIPYKQPLFSDIDVEYTVFITWAIWPGRKVFQRDVQSCISSVRENKKSRIELILVNLDMQQDWGEENLKKVEFTRTSINLRTN